MKILIGGSMSFASQMYEVKSALEALGHEANLSPNMDFFTTNAKEQVTLEQELAFCRSTGIVKKFFDEIPKHEGMIVLNYDKKGIHGYLGTSVLMEIAIAYFLGKKIYLLHDIDRSQPYALEVLVIDPMILNGDLSLIK